MPARRPAARKPFTPRPAYSLAALDAATRAWACGAQAAAEAEFEADARAWADAVRERQEERDWLAQEAEGEAAAERAYARALEDRAARFPDPIEDALAYAEDVAHGGDAAPIEAEDWDPDAQVDRQIDLLYSRWA